MNEKLTSYEKIRQCIVVKEPWTVDKGLMTPTLKVKRHAVEKKYQNVIEKTSGQTEHVVWEV